MPQNFRIVEFEKPNACVQQVMLELSSDKQGRWCVWINAVHDIVEREDPQNVENVNTYTTTYFQQERVKFGGSDYNLQMARNYIKDFSILRAKQFFAEFRP